MASTPTQTNPLISLGKGIYLSRPVDNAQTSETTIPETSQPTVILIFGWMGAKLPHLLKYINKHDQLYPAATKILVRSEAPSFWASKSKRHAYLAPVLDVLEALGCLTTAKHSPVKGGSAIEPLGVKPPPRILIHSFSNGGCWQLTTLSGLIAERYPESSYPRTNLPPTAVVLDSCPGTGGIRATQKAFLAAVRNPILRRLAALVITILYVIGLIGHHVFGIKTALAKVQEGLNKPYLLPWFSKETPRLYIYSAADELIPSTQVEEHARGAKAEGLTVKLERFENSPHVAHARADPDRYWGAVTALWSEVSKGKLAAST
ncbi:hypothetical protein BKA70DRAFT_1278261 [Coprinopsis sp. MPI-PUGE-AT-0042]|nr:hypothetical protein BKA70DRAFT_1278261 [Coprinopsis sp. MPI-PUGE-AT-0042]